MIPKMRSNKTVGALLWFSMFALITANVSLSSDVNSSFIAPCSDVTDFGCDGMVKQDVENNCGSGENKCNAELPSMDDYFAMDFVYCKSDEFRCSDGKCIENVHVCDGNHDCSQGEDEGGLCGVCNVYHCDGECRDLPSGPQCLCPEHMTLAIDGKTCRSENTCDSNEALRCTQLCVKKSNKALCSCSEGYTQNEADCIVEEHFRNGNLFFIDGDKSVGQLSLFNQSNSSSEEFMLPMTASMDYISSLTFETEEQRLYFVGVSDGSRLTGVYRSSDLELKELVFEGIGLRQISYDWVGKNIYYASNGYGIGVCSTKGKHCSHLLAGRKIVPNERAQEYVNLIVHPKRGLLIWLEYNSEHLNGIVMTAGMDGARPRNLVVNAMEKITSIALDYVTDRLYVMEGNELSFVDLQSMQRTTVTRKTPAQAVLFFDGYIYFVSKNKRLSRFKNDTTEFLRPLNGDRFSFAINNTLYYKSMNDPCKALSCSHMCVLSESSEDVAKGKCICPDMYERNSQGVCTYRPHDKPVIKTSEEHMKQMCNEETACLNGGSCGENYNGGPIPSCECATDYSGQYCEIKLAQSYTKQTSGSAWFIVLFVALAVSLFVMCYKLRLAAKIRLPFSFNPRTLRGNLATLIGFGQPATTGIRSSPRTLLMNSTSQKDLESAYSSDGIRLMSQLRSFSNPTAMITEQRLDEQVLEQEIQISPDASLLQKPLSSPADSRKTGRSERSSNRRNLADEAASTSFPSKSSLSFADKEFVKALTSHAWYHGMMPRHEIEEMLKHDGDFLMRATDVKGMNRLCVSVFNAKRVRHILLKQNSGGEWYIRNEPKDKSVINLIQTSMDKKLPIQPDGTLLVTPISRPDYYILHENVEVKDRLGGGNFGDVHKAILKQADGKSIEVAVKKLKSAQGKKGRSEFVKEAKIMRDLHHDNIVQVVGVAPQEEPMLILIELCKGGSLDRYLMKHPDASTEQLVSFTKDACRGMRYLSGKKIIHRDLAARNCLLGDKNQVKISDFGLAHENQEAFNVDKLKNVPIRWLSPETLNRGEFSVKTDVWSFGVLVWEIFSKCQSEPYPKMNNTQVKAKIKSGEEPMSAPKGTPSLLANAMSLCFTQDPQQRPDFQTLHMLIAPGEK